ncbi:DUF6365 family protein [Virgisporangium aurantiacum]|uniref:Uncharacterized protein n=1 Tax=Virgisporangium aurantiacum TaxID=175570 RepID=A0A8J3ZCJ0_9ACTN|nr:DUF6365 family protein [Virgisporangium aurantiacum]GIJ60412.1 hypothetical protein Vau01_079280 [Virgisporangium aurantiacum]
MRLLHFAPQAQSSGETFIGVSLADQLRAAGMRNHFVVTPGAVPATARSGHPYTVMDPTTPVRELVDGVVREFRPDAVVTGDYLSYWTAMHRMFRVDPWFLDGYHLPVLPIDLTEWEDTGFAIDIAGAPGPVPVDRHILDMAAYLRPVPIAHLHSGSTGRAYPYRLQEPEPPVYATTRDAVLDRLGLKRTDRLLMVPVSAWQRPSRGGPERTSSMVDRLARAVPELLVHYLRQLPAHVRLLTVGPVPDAFAALPADRVRALPPCPADEFRTLLGSVDAVLTLCLPAVSAIRAVLMDVPVVALSNRFRITGAGDIAALEAELGPPTPAVRAWLAEHLPVDPFRMWPKGLHTILEPILTDNPYLSAIAPCELFDEPGTVTTLTCALTDAGTRDRLAAHRARYLAAIRELPPTARVLTAAVQRAGARVT